HRSLARAPPRLAQDVTLEAAATDAACDPPFGRQEEPRSWTPVRRAARGDHRRQHHLRLPATEIRPSDDDVPQLSHPATVPSINHPAKTRSPRPVTLPSRGAAEAGTSRSTTR